MTKVEAAELFKKQMGNEALSDEMKAAMKVAVAAMEHLEYLQTPHKARKTQEEVEAELRALNAEKCCSRKYFSNGRCTGQKGMPECTPNCGYCPCKKDCR